MERVVFLFDVDNTLLDNDRVSADLKRYLTYAHGPDVARHPAPDVTIDRIADLATYDMPALVDAARQKRTR